MTNNTAQPVNGSLTVILANLTSGVTLLNSSSAASPVVALPGTVLNPGQSASAAVTFSNPSNLLIDFTPEVVPGS